MVISINKYLLWHLFAGTRGGLMRMKVIKLLERRPLNANQLTKEMKIDYKTARHHLKVLMKNRLIQNISIDDKNKYGATYHLSGIMESSIETFNEIWEKVNKQSKGFGKGGKIKKWQ